MKNFIGKGGFSRVKISNLESGSNKVGSPNSKTVVWTSEKVSKIIEDHENGISDVKKTRNPFKDNDPAWRKPGIIFEYSPEEIKEIKKCRRDPLYFAENYAKILTEEGGVRTVKLREYQREIIESFASETRYHALMASRQIGKCLVPYSNINILINSPLVLKIFLNFSKNSVLDFNTGLIQTTVSELHYFLKYRNGNLSRLDRLKRSIYATIAKYND